MKQNKKTRTQQPKIEIKSIEPLSAHNKALYETGKEMLKSSLSSGRDFCKFMISMSTGAIPIYIALIKFTLAENIILSNYEKILLVIPPFIFLISALIFIFGYQPQVKILSLDIIDEIKQTYEKTIKKRKKFIDWGIISFLVGTGITIFFVIFHLI